MSALAILIAAVRSVVQSLRAIAHTLEGAATQAEAAQSVNPSSASNSGTAPEWDLISEASAQHPADPLLASGPLTAAGYDGVAAFLTGAPPAALELGKRLGGSPESQKARVQRAWEAGLWARATIEGRVAKPRPSPKSELKARIYVILRAPGVRGPVVVDTAAEYFNLLPRSTEDSLSHSFASQAEGEVYCLAAGVSFPASRGVQ